MHALEMWLGVHYKKKDIIQQILLQKIKNKKNNGGSIYTIASLGCFLL